MPITVIQSIGVTRASGVGSLASATFASPITGGNTIIVCVATEDGAGSGAVIGATDSNGNTYTIDKQVGPTAAADRTAILSVLSAIGGASNVITVTTSGNCFLTILGAIEVSGLGAVDVSSGQTGSGGTVPEPGSTTTTNANDLLVSCYASNQALSGSTVPSSPGTWTRIGSYTGNTFENGDSAYTIVAVTESGISPQFTQNPQTGQWADAFVAYSASGGGGGVTSHLLALLGVRA
jgi:hypothetical protein